jgi:DNA-binding SARP family transcriptional activator/tetratricopeptide (TPR) repeat protein
VTAAGGGLAVGLLGPLRVSLDGRTVTLTAGRLRTLLAVIAMAAGRPVSVDRLATALWDGDPPADARKAVQMYVARLRKALGGGASIDNTPAGYVLRVEPDQVDALRFLRLVDTARTATGPAAERALLTEALALWHGQPFEDVPSAWLAEAEASRLVERRLTAAERGIDLDLAAGSGGPGDQRLVAEVTALAEQHPLRESLWLRLLLVLERSGRRAEALARYEAIRVRLADELGADPGPELRRVHADLLAGRPPAEPALPAPDDRADTVVPRQLPPDIGDFTGRHEELRWLRDLVGAGADQARSGMPVPAIAGAAGVGKSALAIHAAHELAARFPDGQLYVDLRAATAGLEPLAPLEVLGRFLRALGVPGRAVPAQVDEAAAAFRSRSAGLRLLVVLDNAADAAQVRPLLPSGPDCAVLVTSRRALTGLESARHLHLDVLAQGEAVGLLRALAGDARVDADPVAAVDVAGWCGRLPLALRIAGARLAARPNWPVRALAARLADTDRRLDELAVAESGVRVSFAVSYQQLRDSADPLDRAAAAAYPLLGLLNGPDVAVPAAARLLDEPDTTAERVLERLVDVQLLQTCALGRYRLHDLLRLYARDLARQQPEEARAAALTRVAEFCTATAWRAAGVLRPGDHRLARAEARWRAAGLPLADEQAALAWLEAERTNLVALVRQATEDPGVPDGLVVQLAMALYPFFDLRHHFADWLLVNETALGSARRAGDLAGQGQLRNDLGVWHWWTGDYERAFASLRESAALFQAAGDPAGQAASFNNIGLVYNAQGRRELSVAVRRESLALHREAGDRRGEASTLGNIGNTLLQLSRYDEALPCIEDSLAIFLELGDRRGQAIRLANLGELYARRGDEARARRHLEDSMAIFRELGDRAGLAGVLVTLGYAHRHAGRFPQALACLRESRDIHRQIADLRGQTVTLRELAITFQELGRLEEARAHLREALAIFEQRLPGGDAGAIRDLLAQLPATADCGVIAVKPK